MIHYLIIRKDLPFGVTLAQLAHAAGNSMQEWCDDEVEIDYDPHPQEGYCNCSLERPTTNGPLTVVVLGVKNQKALLRVAGKLKMKHVHFHLVREPDPPYLNQAMAIGVWPGEKDELKSNFKRMKLYKELGV